MSRPEFPGPSAPVEPERHDGMDLYLPEVAAGQPSPAVVVVHGGPDRPTPYHGSVIAARGVVGVTVDLDLDGGPEAYERADARVRTAIGQVRDDRRVDADRIALWFFADSGLLSAEWLRTPPEWLRCVALTYPLLDVLPDRLAWPRFRPITAVKVVGVAASAGVAGAMRAGELPIVLTRVGGERPEIATAVEAFVATAEAANADLTIVDAAAGRDTDETRLAFTVAVDHVLATLR
jgi:hypothetical protein